MKRFLFRLWQWIWGLPQTLAGGLLYLYYVNRGCPHFPYQGASVVIWPRENGSMSLGGYVFLYGSWARTDRATLAHEYGHCVQSLLFGPLYLLAVGLPSILWAGLPVFRKRRREQGVSYYSVYPEHSATRLGERFARQEPNPGARQRPRRPAPAP